MAVTNLLFRPIRTLLLIGITLLFACGEQSDFLSIMIHDSNLHISMEVLAYGDLLDDLDEQSQTFTLFAPHEGAHDAFGREALLEVHS